MNAHVTFLLPALSDEEAVSVLSEPGKAYLNVNETPNSISLLSSMRGNVPPQAKYGGGEEEEGEGRDDVGRMKT